MRRKRREMREEREGKLLLLFKIYRAQVVVSRRAKNKSSSTRQGLCVGTENTRFRQGFKRGVREIKGLGFKKCPQDSLEFLLRSKR